MIGLSDNASEEEQGNEGTIYVRKVNRLKTSWDPGVRVGIGWNSCCDGWDFYLNWTYFKNCEKGSASGNVNDFIEMTQFNETLILNPWATSEDATEDNFMLRSASAKWRVRFNQIDLEIGRKYWLSPCFNLRPFAALRGAWTRTKFSISNSAGPVPQDNENGGPNVIKRSNQFKNRLWGAGFLTGIQPTWYFCCNFALYSQLDVALLWGEQEGKKSESTFRSIDEEEQGIRTRIDASNHSTDEFFQMSPILDVGIGLRWEESWCCDRYRTALDLGWEHHHWFNHSLRHKTVQSDDNMNSDDVSFDDAIQSFFEEASDLGYGGFVLRLRFDF